MRIVVVGGGIAGLAAAARVRALADEAGARPEIVVIEQANVVGGKLRTGCIAGGPVELGAEAFLTGAGGTPDAWGEGSASQLARRVGLSEALRHPSTARAAIAVGGQLRPVPAGTLVGVPADVSALDGLARPSADGDHDGGRPLVEPGADVAVGQLVRARYGHEVVDRLVDPMLGGVYAGSADELSLAATMPALYARAQTARTLRDAVAAALADGAARRVPGQPIFTTVEGGLSRLVEGVVSLARATVRTGLPVRELGRAGDRWRLTVGATRDPEYLDADAVVLAVPAKPAARLLETVAPKAADALGGLDYASIALVSLALPAGTPLPDLSGFLVPADQGYAVKAATFFSTKWAHLRRPDGTVLVRASLGRYGDTAVLQATDEDLVALVREELADLVGHTLPEPVDTLVARWGGALPQYAPGHLDRVASAREALPVGLALAGAAVDGVGIPVCVTSGEAAAEQVWADLAESRP
ncbi:protoporphyrinogen oxidase [Luedemannella helvata]|uniref:Coproporphyrinogen III oxidase n=1 Tax=Luedemannella helvata TaxID=349315 RepID=A0ABP4XDZ9_9ACTN